MPSYYQNHELNLTGASPLGLEGYFGPGGMRSISATTCLIMVCERFPEIGGRSAFGRVFGVSGPTLPLALWLSGRSAREIQRLHVETDYTDYLGRVGSLRELVSLHLQHRRRFVNVRPQRGLFAHDKFAAFVDQQTVKDVQTGKPLWPHGFVCVAGHEDPVTHQEYQVLFTWYGVLVRSEDGRVEQVSNEPAPLPVAVAASCAIPLIFEQVPVVLPNGRTLHCFDGGMSWEGPLPFMAASAAFSQSSSRRKFILDVGEETGYKEVAGTALYRIICGGRCIPFWQKLAKMLKLMPNASERTYLQINVQKISAADFGAGADKKWASTAECFRPIVERSGLLNNESLTAARAIAERLDRIFESTHTRTRQEGELAREIEAVFIENGLYGCNPSTQNQTAA